MADETRPGFLENVKRRVAAHTDAVKAHAAEGLRKKTAQLREAITPEKAEPIIQPERAFGRDEGGDDVKRVVWTGHTVQTPEGQAYFGAVGLTQGGYYRAAEVQVYGAEEAWRWQPARHTAKAGAISSAEGISANRLTPESKAAVDAAEPKFFESDTKEQIMAELPEHVKALADQARKESGMEKAVFQNMDASQGVDNYGDRGKELDAMRAQKRQDAVLEQQDKTREGPEPGRE